MKLLFCPKCQDARKLQYRRVFCECGKSWGNYLEDGLNAYMGGEAIPLGFDNPSLQQALRNQPEQAPGKRFDAFVIQKNCDTILPNDDEDRGRQETITMRDFGDFFGWIENKILPLFEDPEYVILFDAEVVRKITFDTEPSKGQIIDLDIGYDRYHAHMWVEIREDELQTGNAIEDIMKRFRVLEKMPLPK
jgi:hypothetical protein